MPESRPTTRIMVRLSGKEQAAFDRLKAELAQAFVATEHSYKPLDAAKVIARNKPLA